MSSFVEDTSGKSQEVYQKRKMSRTSKWVQQVLRIQSQHTHTHTKQMIASCKQLEAEIKSTILKKKKYWT